MQPTNEQVERSLAALRDPRQRRSEGSGPTVQVTDVSLPSDLANALSRLPAIRSDRVAEAIERLEAGDEPSPQELADRMLGRFVCDRLR